MCYTYYVREKEFISKVHKHLPKSIYRWKINDAYHGGVPDTYYSGCNGHCFIEYKYQDTLPRKETSKITMKLSAQQRYWLKRQHNNNVLAYAVLACLDRVLVTQDFDLEYVTLKEFNEQSIPFKEYINFLTTTLGEEND